MHPRSPFLRGPRLAAGRKTLLVGRFYGSGGARLTIKIHVAGHLKDYTGRPLDLEIQEARDIQDVVEQLDRRIPSIKDRIFDEHDRTRPYINIYVNEEDIRGLDGESTRTKDGDVIYILPSVAGGKGELSAEGGLTR